MKYTTRPLTVEARNRMTGTGTIISPFRSTWSATEKLLEREMRMIGASNVVMMIDVDETDLRLDGHIRANARPRTVGAALAFDTRRKGSLLIACGRYRNWQDNIRAIALGLEALRTVERYGIVQSAEQYTGWRQIGPPTDDWANVFATYSGWPLDAVHADPIGAYRAALLKAHPDHGGSRQAYDDVQQAKAGYTTSHGA